MVIVAALAATARGWWIVPKHYKSATSPDRSWSVEVTRRRNACYPFADGIIVAVIVRDSTGHVLRSEEIDETNRWEGVESHYAQVEYTNDAIRLGPAWWDGRVYGYWVARKADLMREMRAKR